MLKNGLRRVTALHGALTHLIFVQPDPSLIACCLEGQTSCRQSGKMTNDD